MHMTDEYAARYFHKMGWMWARLEVMKYEKTWGVLTAKSNEKDLREKIAQEIESLVVETSIDNATGMKIRAALIARGNNDSN